MLVYTVCNTCAYYTPQAKVLATFVDEMSLACDKFMTDVIESKMSSSSSGIPSATVTVYEPIRRLLIEMPLRLILGLGDTAPEMVSHLNMFPVYATVGSFFQLHKMWLYS